MEAPLCSCLPQEMIFSKLLLLSFLIVRAPLIFLEISVVSQVYFKSRAKSRHRHFPHIISVKSPAVLLTSAATCG
jgi:hypothetical protein